MTQHYRKSPSGAARHIACPGSLYTPVQLDHGSSEAADEGTEAHDDLYTWLMTGEEPENPEVRENLRPMYEHCSRIGREASEQALEVTVQSERDPDWGGTADSATLSDCGTIMWIDDLKYGMMPVEAEGNAQLVSYAGLWLEKWHLVETIFLSIWQPRTPGPQNQTWEIDADEVRRRIEDYHERTGPQNAEVFAAGDHCRWCPARSTCQHLYDLTLRAAEEEFATAGDPLEEGRNVDRWLQLLDLEVAIKASIKAAYQRLQEVLEGGGTVPGKKLIRKLGNRKFCVSDEKVIAALTEAGTAIEQVTVTKLLSPTQLQAAGLLEPVETLVVRPDAGLAMVAESASGESVERTTAANDFA